MFVPHICLHDCMSVFPWKFNRLDVFDCLKKMHLAVFPIPTKKCPNLVCLRCVLTHATTPFIQRILFGNLCSRNIKGNFFHNKTLLILFAGFNVQAKYKMIFRFNLAAILSLRWRLLCNSNGLLKLYCLFRYLRYINNIFYFVTLLTVKRFLQYKIPSRKVNIINKLRVSHQHCRSQC